MSDPGCINVYMQTMEPMRGRGKYSEWDRFDILERVRPIMGAGWKIDPYTQKITVANPGVSFQTPWWHQRTATNKECGLWHQLIFNYFKIIPRGCQECWKVVVRPRNLKELFALRDMEKVLDRPSKCGIEIRSYTPAHYGGYFYNDSLDQGRECYKIVREAVNEAISPDVKVILKRACTEMELHGGPSPFWNVTKEQVELEDYIRARVDVAGSIETVQTDYMLNHLYKRWVLWAHSHNDMTYLEYTDGVTLYPPPVTYHEGDIDEIKKDLQAARLINQGVPEEKVCEFRDKLRDMAADCGIPVATAGAAFGYYDINPLYIGEEDQTTFPGVGKEAAL